MQRTASAVGASLLVLDLHCVILKHHIMLQFVVHVSMLCCASMRVSTCKNDYSDWKLWFTEQIALDTSAGSVRVRLRRDLSPVTVASVEHIIRDDLCEGCNFYRCAAPCLASSSRLEHMHMLTLICLDAPENPWNTSYRWPALALILT